MSVKSKYTILEPLVLALMVTVGMLIGTKLTNKSSHFSIAEKSIAGNTAGIGTIEEIIRFIDAKYVDDLDQDELIEEAIGSIFKSLDPHSHYISPEKVQQVREDMRGSYVGIGVKTLFYKDTVYISQVTEGTPAKEAGLQRGDQILYIENDTLSGSGKEYADVKKYFDRKLHEQIDIQIKRDNQLQTIRLKTENIVQSAVEAAYEIAPDIAYIKLKRFNETVYTDFMEAIEEFAEGKDKLDLILDLRDNPGGYLPQTVKILNQIFKEKGKLLVYTVARDQKKIEYKSNGKRFYNINNVIVLINEGSASASEIIAGAIQDWDRGLVIGNTSYGKGLVQEQYPLKNGGAIRLTVSKYYTPAGRLIQKPFDNLLTETHVDSTIYKTRHLKRELNGSGGISPDVFEGIQDDIQITETCQFALDNLEIFSLKENDQRLREQTLLSKMHVFLSEGEEVDASLLCSDILLEEYHNNLNFIENSTLDWYKMSNKSDPVVDLALEKIQSADLFADLTTQNK